MTDVESRRSSRGRTRGLDRARLRSRPRAHADAVGRRGGRGFTTGEPWLPLADDYAAVNVEAQRDDPGSMLSLHRKLIALRKAEPDLVTGAYRTLSTDDGVLRFARGDSLEVRIDFAAGDGAILKHGSTVRDQPGRTSRRTIRCNTSCAGALEGPRTDTMTR